MAVLAFPVGAVCINHQSDFLFCICTLSELTEIYKKYKVLLVGSTSGDCKQCCWLNEDMLMFR